MKKMLLMAVLLSAFLFCGVHAAETFFYPADTWEVRVGEPLELQFLGVDARGDWFPMANAVIIAESTGKPPVFHRANAEGYVTLYFESPGHFTLGAQFFNADGLSILTQGQASVTVTDPNHAPIVVDLESGVISRGNTFIRPEDRPFACPETGVVMVPFRAVMEGLLGAFVGWEEHTQSLTVFWDGAPTVRLSLAETGSGPRIQLVDGRTFVDIRFITEAFEQNRRTLCMSTFIWS